MMKKIDLKSAEPIFKRYGVRYAGVFGSRSRGEHRRDSDLDLLVKLSRPMGFFKFLKLEEELSENFDLQVDLVTENSLSPYFRKEVLDELDVIYEKR
ncbi:MAG: nucleotidyltransferase family protein [Candidatus Vogelbacteria bacterium]|nr:nucleotidyltransferase family protein [Candidatus Vogelbacteria bacterium]